MSQSVSAEALVHAAAATTPEEWQHARRLVGEMIDWLASAVGLEARLHQHDSNEELDSLHDFYKRPAGQLIIGYVAGKPSGTTGIHLMDAETAELRRVWVTPSARGNGLAPVLLRTAIETARDLGAKRIWLETASGHMDKAIAMYTRAGFRPIPAYSSLPDMLPGILTLGMELG